MTSFSLMKLLRALKGRRFYGLFLRNFLLICLVLLLPLIVIVIVSTQSYSKFTEKEIALYSDKSIASIKNITDAIIGSSLSKLNYFSVNEDVRALDVIDEHFEQFSDLSLIRELINSQIMVQDCIGDIYIYSPNHSLLISQFGYCDLSRFYDLSWIESYERNSTSFFWWYNLRQGVTSSNTRTEYLSLYKVINPLTSSKGVIVINIDFKKFAKQYLNDIKSVYDYGLCIVDENNQLIRDIWGSSADYLPDSGKLLPSTENDYVKSNGYILFKAGIQGTHWSYVLAVSPEITFHSTVKLIGVQIKVILTGFLLSLVIAFMVSLHFYRPLGAILNIIGPMPDSGNGSSLSKGKHENYIVSSVANTMQINTSMRQELENRRTMLKQAQQIALQAQINPHFLYNTLDDINWAAIALAGEKIGKNPQGNNVSSMLSKLSFMLRYSLEKIDVAVPLSDEINHAKAYIELVAGRFANLFSVHWQISPDTFNLGVIKILLQPLLENAIEHGICPVMDSDGLITVGSRLAEGCLLLTVADNGAGMDDTQLNEFNASLRSAIVSIQEQEHIGLNNVNQRVRLFYGDEYGLELARAESGGTVVTVRLPKNPA